MEQAEANLNEFLNNEDFPAVGMKFYASSGSFLLTGQGVTSEIVEQISDALGMELETVSSKGDSENGMDIKLAITNWKDYRDWISDDQSEETEEEPDDSDDDNSTDDLPAEVENPVVEEDETPEDAPVEEPKAEKPKAKAKPKKDEEPVVINSIDNAEEEFKTAMEDAGYKVRSRSRGVGFFTKVAGIRQLKRTGEWEITFYLPEDKKEKVVFDDEALVRLEELLEEVSEEEEDNEESDE